MRRGEGWAWADLGSVAELWIKQRSRLRWEHGKPSARSLHLDTVGHNCRPIHHARRHLPLLREWAGRLTTSAPTDMAQVIPVQADGLS